MLKKKLIIGVLAITLVTSIAVGTSLAFLSDNDTVTNTFVIGDKVDIDIEEPNWPVNPDPVTPGTTLPKDPTVVAVEGDSYMRIKMEIKDTTTGQLITNTDRINKILETIYNDTSYALNAGSGKWETSNIIPGTAYKAADILAYKGTSTEFAFDTTRVTDAGVRYYNYVNTTTNNIFKATTPANRAVLFTNIVVPTDWTKTEIDLIKGTKNADGKTGFQIVLTAQAIQTDNIATAEDGYKALDDQQKI